MSTPGRQSSKSKETAALVEASPEVSAIPKRPEAPEHLSPEAKAEWDAVVTRLPVDWFKREQFPILESFCEHTVNHRLYQKILENLPLPADHNDVKHHKDVASMARDESKAALACARSLRFTLQAQYDTKKADRKQKGSDGGVSPWSYGQKA